MEQLLDRHRRFWERDDAAGPLVGRAPERVWEPRPYPVRGGGVLVDPTALLPEQVDVPRLIGADRPAGDLLLGDLILPATCLYPEAWMESLIGCSIVASAYGVVSRPTGRDPAGALEQFSVKEALASPWARVMDQVLLELEGLADGRAPVTQLHLRGIIDMLAACLGEAQLCTAVYDCPQALADLARAFADLHAAVARRGLELRSEWRGGYVSVWNVYAPGPLLDYQIDASSLFSPAVYEERFLEHDRRVLGAFPYNVTHLHACGLHVLPALLRLEEVRAVEISLDRETGVWEKARVLDCCAHVQEAGKCLILDGELSGAEFDEFVAALRPGGLAIHCWSA